MPDKTTIHMVPDPRKSGLTKRTLTYCNQKRRSLVRMAIGLRGLERNCPLVCL